MIDLFKRQSTNQALIAGGSVCVWGPTGSPGKSTLALNLACELASSGKQVLLLDLDTYSASIGTLLGVAEPGPGVAAAARLVGQDRLDSEQFLRLAIKYQVGKGAMSVLAGLSSELRWPELTAEKVRGIISLATQNYDYVILDVASPLEAGLKHVGGVVDRNVSTRTALEVCTRSIAVFNADQIGVKRLCDSFAQMSQLAPSPILIANRFRTTALGSGAKQQIKDALLEMCQSEVNWFIPEDRASCDRAVLDMIPLVMLKRSSVARQAIAQFVRQTFEMGAGLKAPVAI
jgi:MinD-like ATPase involved in chromosome partitioning or flagellar assembly